MPLANIRQKREAIGGSLRRITKKLVSDIPLEAILVLLILCNLVIKLKIILGIYIILYFLDRWEIKRYIKNINEITVKKDENKTI
jgi:hypothetical protein